MADFAEEASEHEQADFDRFDKDLALPSGNWSFTYGRDQYNTIAYDLRVKYAAVAVMMRYPDRISETHKYIRNSTLADVSSMVACAKFEADDEEGGEGGDDEGSAAGIRVPVAAIFTYLSVTTFSLWI